MIIKSDNHICIGSNLKRIREKRGLMQADVIRELQLRGHSIQKQNYSRIEKEQEHIPASVLYELHDIFGVSLEELFIPSDLKER